MKVSINSTLPIYKNFVSYNKKSELSDNNITTNDEFLSRPILSLANFPNVSFKMDPHMTFLLGQSKKFKCAYSGRDMISPTEVKTIYTKLLKRPNAQSAINFLKQYEKYMHNIESKIFNMFEDASHKNKRNFQDILQEEAPAALERLKEKQRDILNSVDKHIEKMSEPLAEQVYKIRDDSLVKMDNGTFGRKAPLEAIKKIQAKGKDLEHIIAIYRSWYKLPSSGRDFDAFVVSYSKKSHEEIAKRLISSAVATVEHIKPQSCGGEDKLANYLLVSAQYNNERNTMPLWEYIMLNPQIDIRKNLQAYMDTLINEVHNKRSDFYDNSWYPESIRKAIDKQTSGSVVLSTDKLVLTRSQKRSHDISDRLSTKYTVIKK